MSSKTTIDVLIASNITMCAILAAFVEDNKISRKEARLALNQGRLARYKAEKELENTSPLININGECFEIFRHLCPMGRRIK